jgi:hypothetical protein
MKTFRNSLLKFVFKLFAFSCSLLGVASFFAAFVESVTPGRSAQASSFLLLMLGFGFAAAFWFFVAEEQ